MTIYTIRLYTDPADPFYSRRIQCNRKDVPKNLADIVADHLENAPYLGPILARIIIGQNYTKYLIELKNGAVIVYR